MADSPRIEELRRRVQMDPASIAFAALAEEYRRIGRYQESIDTCLAGLQRHPAYLSARVTLGRSLIELGRYEEAREQLEQVLRVAPENLAATKGLAEIESRRASKAGRAEPSATAAPHTVDAPAPQGDPKPAENVESVPVRPVRLSIVSSSSRPAAPVPGLESASEPHDTKVEPGTDQSATISALEAFLGAIDRARAALRSGETAGR